MQGLECALLSALGSWQWPLVTRLGMVGQGEALPPHGTSSGGDTGRSGLSSQVSVPSIRVCGPQSLMDGRGLSKPEAEPLRVPVLTSVCSEVTPPIRCVHLPAAGCCARPPGSSLGLCHLGPQPVAGYLPGLTSSACPRSACGDQPGPAHSPLLQVGSGILGEPNGDTTPTELRGTVPSKVCPSSPSLGSPLLPGSCGPRGMQDNCGGRTGDTHWGMVTHVHLLLLADPQGHPVTPTFQMRLREVK